MFNSVQQLNSVVAFIELNIRAKSLVSQGRRRFYQAFKKSHVYQTANLTQHFLLDLVVGFY